MAFCVARILRAVAADAGRTARAVRVRRARGALDGGLVGHRVRAVGRLAGLDLFLEHLFVGLRLSAGVRPEPAEGSRFEQPIRRFLDAGLLESDGATLRLTNRGVLLSNEVFQEFLVS